LAALSPPRFWYNQHHILTEKVWLGFPDQNSCIHEADMALQKSFRPTKALSSHASMSENKELNWLVSLFVSHLFLQKQISSCFFAKLDTT
jgi:hypothetical protein